jgi:hypothetical protein
MKQSRLTTQIAAAIALSLAVATGASAAVFIPDEYTAPGGFSGVFSGTGGDNGSFFFDIVKTGKYLIELTPSPLASNSDWAAEVIGFGALTHATSKLLGSFDLLAGSNYELFIQSPAAASLQGYSVSGVMASAEVPLPGTIGLLGLGMFALGMVRRKQQSA